MEMIQEEAKPELAEVEVKIRPFRYGNGFPTYILNEIHDVLKSDRFGMEILKQLIFTLGRGLVKIRPFRYGNVSAVKFK